MPKSSGFVFTPLGWDGEFKLRDVEKTPSRFQRQQNLAGFFSPGGFFSSLTPLMWGPPPPPQARSRGSNTIRRQYRSSRHPAFGKSSFLASFFLSELRAALCAPLCRSLSSSDETSSLDLPGETHDGAGCGAPIYVVAALSSSAITAFSRAGSFQARARGASALMV